ncbi:MAG: hypothetical protein U5L96_14695 [Owenweeksia sp.]|nr:hypothetical protein [Owenweeksia sp.]
MGIGGIPNAVLYELQNHKGLGIHTEMFSNGILPLIEKEAITGEHKGGAIRERIVSRSVTGSQDLDSFVDDNPMVNMRVSF